MSKITKAMEKAEAEKASEKVFSPWQDNQDEPERSGSQDFSPSYALVRMAIERSSITIPPDPRHLENNRILGYLDDSRIENYYSLLRTRVLQKTREQGHNTIMVVDSINSEGATLTAINLAISIASEVNHSAILIDTQLRHPKIHKYLGIGEHKGLTHYLLQENSLLLINPGMERLHVLLSGIQMTDPTTILGSPRMKRLIAEMKSYSPNRYIILTSSPLLSSPDALVLMPYMDAIILVVEAERTRRDQILKACEMLQGQNILGIVLNNVRLL